MHFKWKAVMLFTPIIMHFPVMPISHFSAVYDFQLIFFNLDADAISFSQSHQLVVILVARAHGL